MRRLFGTDGIRGVAGEPPLNRQTLWKIGTALAETGVREGAKPRTIIGRDTRVSGEWIVEALEGALVGAGVESISDVGVISTPGLAYLTRIHEYDLGIMISASHNPFEDNGIKIFGRDGFKLSDEQELSIERAIDTLENRQPSEVTTATRPVRLQTPHLIGDYVSFLKSQIKKNLNPLRIGLDVCNGAAYQLAPEVFKGLGAKVSVINDQPDGRNINLNCGSLHLGGIIQLVKEQHLDFGVAFDGDADRSLFVTSSGKVFDGDFILYALALHFQANHELKTNKVVGTIMTNYALELAFKRHGIELLRAPVGDRYVWDVMKQEGANLGAEPSGHVILSDCHTAGDGILTAVKLAEILAKQRSSLDKIGSGFSPYPQVLDGLKVKNRVPLDSSPEIARLIRTTEAQLNGEGRLVVRYSGTEPLLRIMAEGPNAELVQALVAQLKADLAVIYAT